MQIGPDEIDVELPRAVFGGLKQGPTEALLRRVATDYAAIYEENRTLKATIRRLQDESAQAAAAQPAHAEQSPAQPDHAAQVDGVLESYTAPSNGADASGTTLAHEAPREVAAKRPAHALHAESPRDTDEFARIVLASAQTAAREMRESARRDCEAMLKKAGARARELENANSHVKTETQADIDELLAIRRDTCARMRTSLETLLATP